MSICIMNFRFDYGRNLHIISFAFSAFPNVDLIDRYVCTTVNGVVRRGATIQCTRLVLFLLYSFEDPRVISGVL